MHIVHTDVREHGLPAERITSVPTGIDTQRFMPGDKTAARLALGLDPAPCYIGIVATLRSWKGHLFLTWSATATIPSAGCKPSTYSACPLTPTKACRKHYGA
jgi:hypothetical protein